MISRRYSLSAAARLIGVNRHTLKAWLVASGLFLESLDRGSKFQLSEQDIERVLRTRSASSNPSRLRVLREAHRQRKAS